MTSVTPANHNITLRGGRRMRAKLPNNGWHFTKKIIAQKKIFKSQEKKIWVTQSTVTSLLITVRVLTIFSEICYPKMTKRRHKVDTRSYHHHRRVRRSEAMLIEPPKKPDTAARHRRRVHLCWHVATGCRDEHGELQWRASRKKTSWILETRQRRPGSRRRGVWLLTYNAVVSEVSESGTAIHSSAWCEEREENSEDDVVVEPWGLGDATVSPAANSSSRSSYFVGLEPEAATICVRGFVESTKSSGVSQTTRHIEWSLL